jgi:hypothetical protein
VQNACFGCALFPTKPKTQVIEHEVIFNEVGYIRQQRNSGGGLDLSEISSLQWRLVMIWDMLEEAKKRELEAQNKALFEALITTKGR